MRVFKLKRFARDAKREKVSDDALKGAVLKADAGLIHADLGGHVIKQRVGRRGSHRVLVYFEKGSLAFFAFIFAKGKKANITDDQVETLQAAAEILLAFSPRQLERAIEAGEIVEIELRESEVRESKDDDDDEKKAPQRHPRGRA